MITAEMTNKMMNTILVVLLLSSLLSLAGFIFTGTIWIDKVCKQLQYNYAIKQIIMFVLLYTS